MRLFLLGVAAVCAVGCGQPDDPVVDDEPRPTTSRYPGYCTAASDVDGVAGTDAIRTAIYEDELLVRDEFDSDLDGDTDVVGTHLYDSERRIVRWENDEFADETVDEVRTYEWQENRMVFERWDSDVDDVVDMEIEFQHDDGGRRTRGEGNVNDQGHPELVIGFEYDDDGNNTRIWMDGLRGAPDQSVDRTIDHTYDGWGNVLATWIDVDANGVADILVSYDYECWTSAN